MNKKTLAEQAEEKFGKKDQPGLKEKLNSWLDENINQPLSKKGYSKTGSAISKLGEAAGEYLIPENIGDVALGMIPGGKILKRAFKGAKKAPKVIGKELAEDATKVIDRGSYRIKDEAVDKTKESAAFFSDLELPKKPKPPTASEWKKMTPEQRKAVKELEDQAPTTKYAVTEPDAIGISRQNTAKNPTFKK